MSEKGLDLVGFTDKTYKKIEAADEKGWEDIFNHSRKMSDGFAIFTHGSDAPLFKEEQTAAERQFPELYLFQEQFPATNLSHVSDLRVSVPPYARRPLLGAGMLLSTAAMQAVPIPGGEPYDPNFSRTSLDLMSRTNVTADNVQTMLDVTSLLSRFVQTPEELLSLSERVLQLCPNDDIKVSGRDFTLNPRGYTYLELFALAPFGFWGAVRDRQPQTYHGKPIVHPEDTERPVSAEFMYMLTRERPLTTSGRETRHGGCPALYPAFKDADLINRLGKLFVKSQREFLKLDRPVV